MGKAAAASRARRDAQYDGESNVNLTEAQTNAVERTDRNVVVSAGAGTGKTAVLVGRFINLVRGGLATVNQILTITFTEKAAEEMKRRIADEFHRLGMRREKAAVETSYVSTIHSFCSRLIRENPFAAGVNPEFEVMDDMDRQLLLGELFDELFSEGEDDFLELVEHYGENAISRAIVSYMDLCRSLGRGLQYVEELLAQPHTLTRKAQALADQRAARAIAEVQEAAAVLSSLQATGRWEDRRREVVSLSESLSDAASFRKAAEAMASATAKMPRVSKKEDDVATCLAVREQLARIGSILKQRKAEVSFDREAEDGLLPCKVALLKGVALFWRKYESRKRERGVLDYEDLQLIARGLLTDSPGLLKEYADRFRYVLVDEFQDINWLQKQLIELLTSGDNLFVVGDACQSIYGFRNADVEIFADLVKRSRSSSSTHAYFYLDRNFRSGQNLIHFFNFFFSGLWEKGLLPPGPGAVPALPHTSSGQRGDGSPPGEGVQFHPLRHGRIGGEEPAAPSVEIMLFQQKRENGVGETPEEVRRREAVAVAARILGAVREREIVVQDQATGGSRFVRFGDLAVLCRTRASYPAYAEAFSDLGVPFCMLGGQSFYDKQEIADWINLLTIVDNPLRDIPLVAVLRSPFVAISDETLLLLTNAARSRSAFRRRDENGPDSPQTGFQTQASDDTHAVCARPNPSVARSGEFPARLLDRYVLGAIRQAGSVPGIPDGDRAKLSHFRDLLDDLRSRKDSIPLHRLAKVALDSTPYMTRLLASSGGDQKVANVMKFLDLLREYDTRHGGGTGAFLRFYQVMRYYGPREEEAPLRSFSGDVVKLMTIHAAKGLEFPVVVVADMSRRFNFDTDKFLVSTDMDIACDPWQESASPAWGRKLVFEERKERQLAEEKRLLYVAATRARDHLILAGSYSSERESDFEKANSPMDWLMAVMSSEALIPESGSSSETRLRDATVRLSVDASDETGTRPDAPTSVIERHFQRILAGESIPVDDASSEKFLPRVRSLVERVTSRKAAEPYTPPAELSVSQLIEFDDCPYRFFLREMLHFPDRQVMSSLGLYAAESGNEVAHHETEAELPTGLDKTRFGELVHECLELVDFRAGEEQHLSAIASRFFSLPQQARAAGEMIRRFLRSDDGRRLRNARELLREVPVKASVENVVVSGIIDLLYLNEENHWIILDFKTGTEHLENASQHGRYDFQMLLYAFLVAEATGRRPERAVVHFLGGGTSRSVSTTAEDVKRTGRRVAEIIAAIGGRQFARVAGVRCRQCEYHAVCMAAERESPTAPGGGAP